MVDPTTDKTARWYPKQITATDNYISMHISIRTLSEFLFLYHLLYRSSRRPLRVWTAALVSQHFQCCWLHGPLLLNFFNAVGHKKLFQCLNILCPVLFCRVKLIRRSAEQCGHPILVTNCDGLTVINSGSNVVQ